MLRKMDRVIEFSLPLILNPPAKAISLSDERRLAVRAESLSLAPSNISRSSRTLLLLMSNGMTAPAPPSGRMEKWRTAHRFSSPKQGGAASPKSWVRKMTGRMIRTGVAIRYCPGGRAMVPPAGVWSRQALKAGPVSFCEPAKAWMLARGPRSAGSVDAARALLEAVMDL